MTVPCITPPPFAAGMLSGSLAEPHAAASSTSTSALSDLMEICMVASMSGQALGIRIRAPDYFILTRIIPFEAAVILACRFQATVRRDRA
jgi:hypothetical protein